MSLLVFGFAPPKTKDKGFDLLVQGAGAGSK